MEKQNRMSKKIGINLAFGFLILIPLSCVQAGPQEMGMGMKMGNSNDTDRPMEEELTELRAKVIRLEAALDKNHRGNGATQGNMQMNMTDMADRKGGGMGMKMKGMNKMKMSPESGQKQMTSGSGMMGMDMMKMMGMMHGNSMMGGKMGGMPQSVLPGFPGISHIYHIGATGFFLDHAEHFDTEQLGLSFDQKQLLESVSAKSDKAQKDYQEKIEGKEKEIWNLTGSDEPNLKVIAAKIKEVESVNAEKRIAFIKAVGEAASLLTEEQRKALVTGNDSSSDKYAGHTH